MRRHRFYIKNFKGEVGTEFHLDLDAFEHLIHQWRDIFRLGSGDEVIVFNEEEGEWLAEITSLEKKKGATILLREKLQAPEALKPVYEISLYMAIIKNSNFDLVVEKATELGISHIIPVKTERTVKTNLNFDRLNKLAIEASEQSGRITVPEITEIMELKDAITYAKEHNTELYFGHIAEKIPNQSKNRENNTKIALFIGPEGGWSDEEVSLLQKEAVIPLSLGQYVLRAETAAIVGISALSRSILDQ